MRLRLRGGFPQMIKTPSIRAALTFAVWPCGVFILQKYEYFTAFNEIDNIIGMIPVALVITAASLSTVFIWMNHKKQSASVSAALIFLLVLSIALFPTALRGNWWINPVIINEAEAEPDFSFVRLNEEANLRLISDLPVLDGATALYPVYAAFAEAVYGENIFLPDFLFCTNTRNAYGSLISGERDIIFTARASESQLASAEAAGADLRFTPIGREAFVFLAGKENPVENISVQQIKNIYSGKTSNWRTLGWDGGGKIIAFQRPKGSGSQTGLQNIMGALPIQVPQPLPDASLFGTGSLMKQVSVKWNGVQPALGYSYRYYAAVMYANPDVKFLKVNGIEPSVENIRNGDYPFTGDFYAVTDGEPKGNGKLLIEWILSEQGQRVIEMNGYAAI